MATTSIGASVSFPLPQLITDSHALITSLHDKTGLPAATGPEVTTQVQSKAQGPEPPKPYMRFNVKMTCSGCSGAIERVLKKNVAPPNEYSVSLEDQTVLVWGPSLPEIADVKAKIAKTGKEILGEPALVQ
ncbi:hypothetical protein QFC19_008645 [Naganishia cerealis]|uniref:Uncharacterized protein n=1 Tax=Naganishia cerealis TaxID=610337 RepID=A0ACC2V0R5_9TREE|nr:hypothetical protein QFC19_008645 [Naganishia cerealis]